MACLLPLLTGCHQSRSPREVLEDRWLEQDRTLVTVRYGVPADSAARSIVFDRQLLADSELYLRNPQDDQDFIHIDGSGSVTRAGTPVGRLRREGELLLTEGCWTLYLDGVPLPLDVSRWRIYWVTRSAQKPAVREKLYLHRRMADSFTRLQLTDASCRITSGQWHLAQRGGGMPRDDAEAKDSSVQRAVNPFSVQGSGNGLLTYGNDEWLNYHAEAYFYFGVPKTGNVVDLQTIPLKTDMLIVQGKPDGNQVAFGWRGAEGGFALLTRRAGDAWQLRARWDGKRPPLTNWIRLGLSVKAGYLAEAYLDDVRILAVTLDKRVSGPFHVGCGQELIEFDDVRAWSLPAVAEPPQPLYVRSRNFGDKERKEHSDPDQFEQWARSSETFVTRREKRGDFQAAEMQTAMPVLGDFYYESVPFADAVGKLPPGLYEFTIRPVTVWPPPSQEKLPWTLALRFTRDDKGWTSDQLPVAIWPAGHHEPTLRLARRAADGNRVSVQVGNVWLPVLVPAPGPVRIGIARLTGASSFGEYPQPEHHAISCTNLVNELFEEASGNWRWIDGAFRMACRWACQNQWNFMSCGSPGVPYMSSRTVFTGDQYHEYYLSLRPVFPYDAGDANFSYDASIDAGWVVFRENNGWYNRHDLNFSFCTDGRNPLSGYSVVFGGSDNRETRLLRRGEIVCKTSAYDQLFPTDENHGVVHWSWWKFTVSRFGRRLVVKLNDDPLFDYTDPDPLPGGQTGFWSVRNGFTVARIVSMAAQLERQPQTLYLPESCKTAWQPLLRDSVSLAIGSAPDRTRVTANVGAGFLAVRWKPTEPVDLLKTPMLELPVTIPPETAVNLHLEIGEKSFLIRLTAPLTEMKALLTPQFEKGECFQLSTLWETDVKRRYLLGEISQREGTIRLNLLENLRRLAGESAKPLLRSLTVGNSSNADYLLAGNRMNQAGAWYEVGIPAFRPADPAANAVPSQDKPATTDAKPGAK